MPPPADGSGRARTATRTATRLSALNQIIREGRMCADTLDPQDVGVRIYARQRCLVHEADVRRPADCVLGGRACCPHVVPSRTSSETMSLSPHARQGGADAALPYLARVTQSHFVSAWSCPSPALLKLRSPQESHSSPYQQSVQVVFLYVLPMRQSTQGAKSLLLWQLLISRRRCSRQQ